MKILAIKKWRGLGWMEMVIDCDQWFNPLLRSGFNEIFPHSFFSLFFCSVKSKNSGGNVIVSAAIYDRLEIFFLLKISISKEHLVYNLISPLGCPLCDYIRQIYIFLRVNWFYNIFHYLHYIFFTFSFYDYLTFTL